MKQSVRTFRLTDAVFQLLQRKKSESGKSWDSFFMGILVCPDNSPDRGSETIVAQPKKSVERSIAVVREYNSESIEYRLADFMYRSILNNDDRAKKPNLQKWADVFEKMLRIDKRTHEEVVAMIRYAHQDEFWAANILSPKKLREKFTTLVTRMKGDYSKQRKEEIKQESHSYSLRLTK